MDDVVPGALQRLRAADIIRMAGLAVASLGQEYCRIGAVQVTMRRGTQLLGIVDMSNFSNGTAVSATKNVEAIEPATSEQHRYVVDVEIQSSGLWLTHCTCNSAARSLDFVRHQRAVQSEVQRGHRFFHLLSQRRSGGDHRVRGSTHSHQPHISRRLSRRLRRSSNLVHPVRDRLRPHAAET